MQDNKEALLKEIADIRVKLKDLEKQWKGMGSIKYHHVCPFCEAQWDGRKEKIKECLYCKARILGPDNQDWEWIIDPETKMKTKVRKMV